MASPSEYFALADSEEIGHKIVQRVEDYENDPLVVAIRTRQAKARLYYYGFDESGRHTTSAISRAGDEGELATYRINDARACALVVVNLVTGPKFVWQPRAANIDYDAVRQTELAAALLEHYWDRKKVGTLVTSAAELAIVDGEGFIHPEWDDFAGPTATPSVDEAGAVSGVSRTGDLKFSVVASADVIRDAHQQSYDLCDWQIVRSRPNRYEVAARWPAAAEAAMGTPAEGPKGQFGAQSDTDSIPLFTFYHRPSAILAQGRRTLCLADGTVLEDGPLPLDWIPLHRVVPAEYHGTPFGYTQFWEVLSIQEAADSLNESIISNESLGTQIIAAQEGSNVDPDSIKGLSILYYKEGSKPPEGLNLTKTPPELFANLDRQKAAIERVMLINSIVRGEPMGERASGSAYALLSSQSLQNASTFVASYQRLVQDCGTTTITLFRLNASAPLKIGIVGKHNLNLVQETEVGKDDLSRISQVYIDLGNPATQTPGGRLEMANNLIQMRLVTSPEMYQQVLDTGRLDPITRGASDELKNILAENQDLAQGECPPVIITDRAELHVREHKPVLDAPRARRNPKVVKATLDHLNWHYVVFYGLPMPPEVGPDGMPLPPEAFRNLISQTAQADPLYHDRMLMLSGQQPPAPPMAPGMPPPGAGAPPPPGPPADGGSPPKPEEPGPKRPGRPGEVQPPQMPVNPATQQRWNPQDGGGAVPHPQ